MVDEHIAGIGIDIIETARISGMIERWGSKFLDRVYTENEQKYCNGKVNPVLSYAGRWALKEAVSKAFGTGIGGSLIWLDIGIVNDAVTGAPDVVLSERGRRYADSRNVSRIMISLSHTKDYAAAQAIVLQKRVCE